MKVFVKCVRKVGHIRLHDLYGGQLYLRDTRYSEILHNVES
jgi:hypothetical protein